MVKIIEKSLNNLVKRIGEPRLCMDVRATLFHGFLLLVLTCFCQDSLFSQLFVLESHQFSTDGPQSFSWLCAH